MINFKVYADRLATCKKIVELLGGKIDVEQQGYQVLFIVRTKRLTRRFKDIDRLEQSCEKMMHYRRKPMYN